MVIYALGWYTPIFRGFTRCCRASISTVDQPTPCSRRCLVAILAGYTGTASDIHGAALTRCPAGPLVAGSAVAGRLTCWCSGLPRCGDGCRASRFPFGMSASFRRCCGAAAVPLRPGITRATRLAARALTAFTVADLAYSNGPGARRHCRRATYDALRTRLCTTRPSHLEGEGCRHAERTPAATGSSSPASGSTGPTSASPTSWRTRSATIHSACALYSEATGAGDHIGTAADRKFAPLFPSYASPLADLLGLRYIASGAPIDTDRQDPEAGRVAASSPAPRMPTSTRTPAPSRACCSQLRRYRPTSVRSWPRGAGQTST